MIVVRLVPQQVDSDDEIGDSEAVGTGEAVAHDLNAAVA
jgi:hypothetical protein